MPKIFTCGGTNKRTEFEYAGSVKDGIELIFASGTTDVTADFIAALIEKFRGKAVPGGFSMTNPTPGGVGEWVVNNSRDLNGSVLTPRHASFICGVLVHENVAKASLRGNSVIMSFPQATVRASYQTLGLENIWQLLRKLIWEVKVLQAIPDRIRTGVQNSDPLHYQDARLYAQINAVLTVLSLIDWLYHTIQEEEIPTDRVTKALGKVNLINAGEFRGSMRKQSKLLNACHQIGNANKHLYMYTSAIDESFKARPFDLVIQNPDGTVDLATISDVMSDGIGSVDEMLTELMHWWYDTLDELEIEGKDQFLPVVESENDHAPTT